MSNIDKPPEIIDGPKINHSQNREKRNLSMNYIPLVIVGILYYVNYIDFEKASLATLILIGFILSDIHSELTK